MQRQCVRVPIRAGREDQVLAFVRGFASRRTEVLEALEAEGIAAEVVLFERQGERAALLIYTAGADLVASNSRFEASDLQVDREFKALMAEALDFGGASVLEVGLAVP